MSGYLFVYGSLRSDIDHLKLPREAVTAAARLHTSASLTGRARASGRLHAVGWYPAFIAGAQGQAVGEVWRIGQSSELLRSLDTYEGAEYRRVVRDVQLDDGSVLSAWVYVYDAPLNDAPRIDSGDYAHWIAQQTP